MSKKSATIILKDIMNLLLDYLEELSDYKRSPNAQFLYGEKVAYTECLEWITHWKKASKFGLNFDIEKRYPLE